MTTLELLSSIMKNNSVASISEKQRSYLISLATKEGFIDYSGGYTNIRVPGCFYSIKCAKHKIAAYGGFVGTKIIPGRYNITQLFNIRFTSTGLTGVYGKTDLDHFTREKISFEIL